MHTQTHIHTYICLHIVFQIDAQIANDKFLELFRDDFFFREKVERSIIS